AVWRARFGATADVIGKTLIVNSVPREIVGVMPARFSFPTADTRVWLPARPPIGNLVGDFAYSGVARLAPGATAEQAQRELAAVLPRMAESFPRMESGGSTATWLDELGPTPVVVPLRDEVTGGIAHVLWMLAAAAGLVLLVAWANVANLMMIRADTRQLELAVRGALGASRWRITGHFLGESLLLGATAAVLSLPLVYGAVRALVLLGPADLPRLSELGVGLATVGFIALVAALGVIACAAIPAARLLRADLPIKLRDAARGESTGKAGNRLRATLAVLQIAIALVVSIGSALLLRTAYSLDEVHPGFDADDVTIAWTQLPFARYDDPAAVAFYARLAERVGQLRSVGAVGLAAHVPLGSGESLEQAFTVEGLSRTLSLPVNVVDDGYFATLGIPLLAGRGFRRIEPQPSADIVISQRASATIFGDPSGVAAVGKRLTLPPAGPTYTVVGVVGDVRQHHLATAPTAMAYRPQAVPADPKMEPGARRTMALVVRSSGPAGAIVPAIRRILRDLDPTVPLFNVEAMNDVVRASTARLSLALALMTAAAAITLLLGSIGLYGVMAYMVALRSREFGVRIALGADPQRIARWVAMRALALTAGGVAAGFALYAIAAPFLRALLHGVAATDPLTLAGATLLLFGATFLASWLPARRAARIDPAVALRAE
nr:ABC transporter permease [Burkholderiales bacterium]